MNLMTGKQMMGTTGIELVRSAVTHGVAGVAARQSGAGQAGETMERRNAGLVAEAKMGCDARVELVASLRARIAAGTYRVASADVAESLMGAMRA